MKAAAIAFAIASFAIPSLAITATAAASGRATDLDYLRANRCKGLATALGASDTTGLDAFIKTEGRSRDPIILDRGADEMQRAKREARDSNSKDRLSAELSGACSAYMNRGGSTTTAR